MRINSTKKRKMEKGIPRVAIVVTDGMSNEGGGPWKVSSSHRNKMCEQLHSVVSEYWSNHENAQAA